MAGLALDGFDQRAEERVRDVRNDQRRAAVPPHRGQARPGGGVLPSNHEGALVDKIHQVGRSAAGVVANLGAYTHTRSPSRTRRTARPRYRPTTRPPVRLTRRC